MPSDLYLGTIQFGTEAFHAQSEVLFSAGNYSLGISENQDLQVSQLEAPKPIPVPDQVPTMKRFETQNTAGPTMQAQLVFMIIMAFVTALVVDK